MSSGLSKLTAIQRRILERKLYEDSEELNDHFCLLLARTQSYLLNNCTCKSLVANIMSTKHVRTAFKDSSLNELKFATSTDDVICVLVEKDLLSFLHYKLIDRIVTSCCNQSDEIKDLLKNYKKMFNDYIKRRVCETSLYYDGKFKVFSGSDSKETVKLVIITDENWDDYTPFLRVKEFESIIANAFRCDKIFLILQSIEPQCLKLRYALIPSLVDHIFPLTLEEWNKLRSHGVAEIHCRDYHYMVDGKCTLHMIHVLCNVALTVMYFHVAAATGKGFGDVVCTDQQYSSKGMLLSKERISYSHVQCENHFKMPFRLLCWLRNVPGQG